MTRATNLRRSLSAIQTARRMGLDLLASELDTTSTVLRWWQSGAPGETDKQVRELAALEKRIRAYVKSDAAAKTALKPKPQYKRAPRGADRISKVDRDFLKGERWRFAKRQMAILRARGLRNVEVATLIGVTISAIDGWRKRFAPSIESVDRLTFLVDLTADKNLRGRKRGVAGPHPMLGKIAEHMAAFTSGANGGMIDPQPNEWAGDALTSRPVAYQDRSPDVHPESTPTLHSLSTQSFLFSTDDDRIIAMRVLDAIERFEAAS